METGKRTEKLEVQEWKLKKEHRTKSYPKKKKQNKKLSEEKEAENQGKGKVPYSEIELAVRREVGGPNKRFKAEQVSRRRRGFCRLAAAEDGSLHVLLQASSRCSTQI